LSATEDNKQQTVLDLLPEYSHLNLFPVGRLDKDTTGTLLITDDGQLAHALLSPKKHVDKIYIATLDKPLPSNLIPSFEKGIILDNELTLPAKLEILDSNIGRITLHQGKYHQVKRMFASFGLEVIELHREKFAFLTVDNLPLGTYRELTKEEEKELLKHKN
jgi:16S rRNA pseudouridine516 synthase